MLEFDSYDYDDDEDVLEEEDWMDALYREQAEAEERQRQEEEKYAIVEIDGDVYIVW